MNKDGDTENRKTNNGRRLSFAVWAMVMPVIVIERAFFGPPPLDGITQFFALVVIIPWAVAGYFLAQVLTKYAIDPAVKFVDFGFPANRLVTASIVTISFALPCALIVLLIDGSTTFQIGVLAAAAIISSIESTMRLTEHRYG